MDPNQPDAPVGMDVCPTQQPSDAEQNLTPDQATKEPPQTAAHTPSSEPASDATPAANNPPPATAAPIATITANNAAVPPTAATVACTTVPTNPAATAAVTPAAQPANDKEFSFFYVLRNYPTIDKPKIYSPFHCFGGFKWRLLIFPRGNQTRNDLSVYLECGGPIIPDASDKRVSDTAVDALARHSPQHSWSRPAHFFLQLVHPSRWEAAGVDLSELYGKYTPSASGAASAAAPPADATAVAATAAATANKDAQVKSEHPGALVARQRSNHADIVKDTAHCFRDRESDWGFCEFAPFQVLRPGMHCDDDMNVVIKVRVRLEDLYDNTHNISYDSRKTTGYVGFKNQGATCYMNSLLQTLYMLVAFRRAVYEMPLPDLENSDSDMTYALQKVFYELQFSPTVVKTKKLTESFGWETTDAFTQHDVQELNRILCDHLEEKMKRTDPDKPNRIQQLFQGKILNYIQCVDVDFKSTRQESFYDLSLNVKGCRNIIESFNKYTEVEVMDGDNKYRADGYDELQRARKGVRFLNLPPVLQLHLKRFEYDFHRDAMVKINDRYEFDTEIDLSPYVDESDGSDIYVLHSVLVHIGDVNGGHYHAFIRTSKDEKPDAGDELNRWLKFDDEHVSIVDEKDAVNENFGVGGEKDLSLITAQNGLKRGKGDMDDDITNIGHNGQTNPPTLQPRTRNLQSRRFMNAYMLQYIRKDDVSKLLNPLGTNDIPKELSDRINRETALEKQRQKDRAEQHLYMVVALATFSDLNRHHGADLTDWDKCKTIRIKRAMLLGELKMQLQIEGYIRDASKVRIWKCSRRQNDTLRPDVLVADGDDTRPMSDSAPPSEVIHNNYNMGMYNNRHYDNYPEEPFRIFVEDLDSEYNFSSGESYAEAKRMGQVDKDLVENGQSDENAMEAEDAVPDKGKERPVLAQYQSVSIEVDLETDQITAPHGGKTPQTFPSYPVGHDEIIVFFKLYVPDPVPTVRFLGHAIVDKSKTTMEMLSLTRRQLERFDIAPDSNLLLYEEQSSGSVITLEPNWTLDRSHLNRGDVVVVQTALDPDRKPRCVRMAETIPECIDMWDYRQAVSRAEDKDLPLGGRPLPSAKDFYNYLRHRIKVEFKDKAAIDHDVNEVNVDDVPGITLELTKVDTYLTIRKILANTLGNGAHFEYLRLTCHDIQRNAPALEPLRSTDTELILKTPNMHIMTPHVLQSHMPRIDYRVMWFERTEYRLSEFEHKEEVRVVWRWDGGTRSTPGTTPSNVTAPMVVQPPMEGSNLGNVGVIDGSNGPGQEASTTSDELSVDESTTDSTMPAGDKEALSPLNYGPSSADEVTQMFSVLVPPLSKYLQVIEGIRRRQRLDVATHVRLLEVRNGRIERVLDPADNVPHLYSSYDLPMELRAEPSPNGETPDALGEDYVLVAVAHLAKERHRGIARNTFFGTPFLIKVRAMGMPIADIRELIREKMQVKRSEFDTWKLGEVLTSSIQFLNEPDQVWRPEPRSAYSNELTTLAIEHRCPTPRRYASSGGRFADKPLKIRS